MQLQPAQAPNPFQCFMDPQAAVEAHARLTTMLIAGSRQCHPLDHRRLVRSGQDACAAFDAEVEADSFGDVDEVSGPDAVS